MIRKAYFEDPAYVPLLLRAYDLWRELERATGHELLRITGLLMVGRKDARLSPGHARGRRASLPFESLTVAEIRARFPTLQIGNDEVGVYEAEGGVLDPERSVAAHLQVAEAAGAEMRLES